MKTGLREKSSILLRQVQLVEGAILDVRCRDGVIAELAPSLPVREREQVVAAGGGLLLPGLIDHHCHLFATAAARQSVQCGPPAVRTEQGLRDLLEKQAGLGKPIRGVGFHESVAGGVDRCWLDQVCGEVPVRIQHRSGMLWLYNSAALELLALPAGEVLPAGVERGPDQRLTGRFYNLDQWLGDRWPRQWPDLSHLSAEYARCGVTAVTDTGVNNGPVQWQALRESIVRGEWQQRIQVMGSEQLDAQVDDPVLALGRGPLKLYLRESELPPLDEFIHRIAQAHRHQRAIAIHCATLVELHFALAAMDSAGAIAGDRIEHASVTDDAALERMADLGVTVVSQPHFIAERGDQYRHAVDTRDQHNLYRAAAFIERGIPFAAGSDAPYGSVNPWRAMAASVSRETETGVVMAAEERLRPEQALALFGGTLVQPGAGIAPLAVGQPADLCLLQQTWEQLRPALDTAQVALTLCDGEIIYQHDQ